MADDYEAEHPDEEQEGGPVKTFLEHLEDLRWVLIKSLTALGVAMLLCLIGGNYVVTVLKWPLTRAHISYPGTNQVALVYYGTNRLATFTLSTNQQASLELVTNRFVHVEIQPTLIGTNRVVGWVVKDDPQAEEIATRLNVELQNLNPAGGFMVAFQVAMYAGMVLAAPLIFYFVISFIFPALRMIEQKYVARGLIVGVGLFFIGASFCYFVLLPVTLMASQAYSNWLGFGAHIWRAEEYISFVSKFILGMGLGFELPVLILTLVKIGILHYGILAKGRRYMIVINLVLGAVLTTPEVFTQVLMAVPLQGLYEITIWIAWYWEQEDKAKARRKLVVGFAIALLIIAAAWAGYKYGWPWLKPRLH